MKDQIVRIKAKEIILEGEKRVVIKSGDSKTIYQAEGGELIEEANQIESSARITNRIKGGSIAIN